MRGERSDVAALMYRLGASSGLGAGLEDGHVRRCPLGWELGSSWKLRLQTAAWICAK